MSYLKLRAILLKCFLLSFLVFNNLQANEEYITDRQKSIGTGVGKLIDLIVSDEGMMTALAKSGIKGDNALQVKNYVNTSLKALSANGVKPDKMELRRILQSLPNNGADGRVKRKLFGLLYKNDSELTKGDLVDAVNELLYMANRYGSGQSTVLACGPCVSDNLSRNGFRFSMEIIENKQAKYILDHLPKNPEDLRRSLNDSLRAFDAGSINWVPANILASEEEKSLALFFGMARHGSASQKKLFKSIMNVSKFDKRSKKFFGHKMWKLFSENLSPTEIDGATRLLDDIAKDPTFIKDGNFETAFIRRLQKQVHDNPALGKELDTLKSKRCFLN